MNEEEIKLNHKIQHADYDDDLIGICTTITETLKYYKNKSKEFNIKLEEPKEPFNYIKMNPFVAQMKYRKNIRKVLSIASKEQNEIIRIQNVYIVLLATLYIYHFPIQELINLIDSNKDINRNIIQDILLKDGMSENWIKEPTDKDFTKLYM